jgi:hypothetical protein
MTKTMALFYSLDAARPSFRFMHAYVLMVMYPEIFP